MTAVDGTLSAPTASAPTPILAPMSAAKPVPAPAPPQVLRHQIKSARNCQSYLGGGGSAPQGFVGQPCSLHACLAYEHGAASLRCHTGTTHHHKHNHHSRQTVTASVPMWRHPHSSSRSSRSSSSSISNSPHHHMQSQHHHLTPQHPQHLQQHHHPHPKHLNQFRSHRYQHHSHRCGLPYIVDSIAASAMQESASVKQRTRGHSLTTSAQDVQDWLL